MFDMDEEFPPNDPGNELRRKMNGNLTPPTPKSFDEVLHTASERGIIDFKLDAETAMRIVQLHAVAVAIDNMPGDEVARIRL